MNRTGIVLAGGRSSRMGQPKLALRLGGQTILVATIRALQECCAEILIVGGVATAHDDLEETLGVILKAPQVYLLRDTEPFPGPVPGLAAALAEATSGGAFVVAGDQPFLRPELVQGMLQRLAETPSKDILLPCIAGREQPLAAVYRTSTMAPLLQKACATGVSSVRKSLFGASIEILSEEALRLWDADLRSFTNINDADDLAKARSWATQTGWSSKVD